VDIIIGSELIYHANENHRNNLMKVIRKYAKPNAVFYSIQSDDREVGGVSPCCLPM